jgi:hypothetical protein
MHCLCTPYQTPAMKAYRLNDPLDAFDLDVEPSCA